MASSTRRRRSSRQTQQPANGFGQTQTIRRGARRSTARSRVAATNNRGGAFSAFLNAGNACIAEMQRYNIPGIDKMKATCGEIAQQLVGAHAFTGTTPQQTTRVASSGSQTGRRSTRSTRVAGGLKLTVPQNTLLGAINPGEQLTPQAICMRCGMSAANVARCLPALKKKGYLQSTGRGKNAIWWKVQQPMLATGT